LLAFGWLSKSLNTELGQWVGTTSGDIRHQRDDNEVRVQTNNFQLHVIKCLSTTYQMRYSIKFSITSQIITLPYWSSYRTRQASGSSPRLHSFFEPVLYGSFEEINKRSLLLCLRTILEEPQLATNVRQYKGWQQPWTFTTYTVTLFFSWRTVKKTVV